MQIGFVGKPSVGKSTLFKAMTLSDVAIASYPFTTIKPNSGVGYVKIDCADKDFNTQCNPRFGQCVEHKRFIPVQLIDVAGLVPGASEGKGMGNQFLDDLNQADALVHVIDISGSINENGEPVPVGSYNPANDIRFLEHELDLWYLRLIEKGWEKFARQINQEKADVKKAIAKQLSSLRVTESIMQDVVPRLKLSEDIMKWDADARMRLAVELRRITKPMMIACNKIDLPSGKENFERLKKEFPNFIMIPCSGDCELALREAGKHGMIKYISGEKDFEILHPEKFNDKQRNALEYIRKNILDVFGSTGIQDVINNAVFNLLGYFAVFPAGVNNLKDKDGNVLPDCFLMPPKTTALEFAFRIHTDLGKKFIRALDVRTKKPVGKDHVLKHRDMVEIIT